MYEKRYRVQPIDSVKKLAAATKQRAPVSKRKSIIKSVGPAWQEFFNSYRIGRIAAKGTNTSIVKQCDQSTQTDFREIIQSVSKKRESAPLGKKPQPATPTIPGYYCTCTDHLFNDEDIAHRSSLAGRTYLFVIPRKTSARVDKNNRIRCSNCDAKLGGWCNFEGDSKRPRLRFSKDLLLTIGKL